MVLSDLLLGFLPPAAPDRAPSPPEAYRALSVTGPVDRPVSGVTHDSREVRPDTVFVALKGKNHDGHDWVPRLSLAAAVVVERDVVAPPGVTVVRVPATRPALAWLSAAYYGHPARRLPILAITGTNGKTTITYLVEAALREGGIETGVVGTTGLRLGGRPWSVSHDPSVHVHTTPESPELQATLARFSAEGARAVIMEASSIGIAAHRVDAIPFKIAGFTNFTRDHLDYHGTMDAYRAAKARLFHELLAPDGVALLNRDDPVSEAMRPLKQVSVTYGLEAGNLHTRDLVLGPVSSRATLVTPLGEAPLLVPLPGRHNVQNALAAVGFALGMGLDPETATRGIARSARVPGRLEPVDLPGRAVLVDFAHTPDALAHAIGALRELTRGRLLVVFGCGGDRDAGKRPEMGRIVREAADVAFVTSDNPRSEDPGLIIDQIQAGMQGSGRATVHAEPDRRAAIREALALAGPDDIVLIAGKGHETTQEIAGRFLPFDDREVAREEAR